MGDQRRDGEKNSAAGLEDSVVEAVRKARKQILNQEMLAKLAMEQKRKSQRIRRFKINLDILEANGVPGRGSKIVDLSMNGAKLELPFSPPFMSQIALKFGLPESEKIFQVVGRVIWSKMTLQKGWYEVGVQFYQNYWEIDHELRLQNR
jgi:PilZ domain